MTISKYKLYVVAFFCAVFFTFSGYYALLVLSNNLIGIQYSRYFTVPIRVLIVLLLLLCLLLIGRKKEINQPLFIAFIAFSLLYISRIVVEILNLSVYHISNSTFLLYFVSFGVLPFVFLFLKKESASDKAIYKGAVLLSGVFLSVLTLFFYRDLIGTVGRISLALSKDENYISPLALSYSGSLSMGVALSLLLSKTKKSLNGKIILIGVALISCVPFFLGASRGSVLALIVPFFLYIVRQQNKLYSFYLFIVLILVGFIVVILSEHFGSSVISRFTSIEADMSAGSSSASRTVIWDIAINHFTHNPIFGYGLESPETGNYPHNIFVEVLLATGVVGFIPFIFLVYKSLQRSLFIFKYSPQNSWIVNIFLQCLIQNLFSGAIYTASWFWFSMAFMLSANLELGHLSNNQSKMFTGTKGETLTRKRNLILKN
jgi:O-antigen ligase